MKSLSIRLSDVTHAELKICAKNLGSTPATIIECFVEDLLEETREPNTAQRWFWQNKNKFKKVLTR